MEHVGMDLGKKESQIAIITGAGELVEKRIRTERARLTQYFRDRPPARILMEASTISEWVARLIEGLGHEVVVADPNYAPMYAQRSRRVKTDKGPRRFGGTAAAQPGCGVLHEPPRWQEWTRSAVLRERPVRQLPEDGHLPAREQARLRRL